MKTVMRFSLYGIVAVLSLILAGCGGKGQYGEAVPEAETTEIAAIMARPHNFEGETVSVSGKIVRECPTGCWFDLQGERGMIYVDLNAAGFAIPQKVGSNATVQGKVKVKDGRATLLGKGVEIQ